MSRDPARLALPLGALAFVALVALGAAADSGLEGMTALARGVLDGAAGGDWTRAGLVTDGAVAWRDWLPLPGLVSGQDLGAAHYTQDVLWVAFALAVAALGRALGISWLGAAAAAGLVAAHPVGVAAHADLAGRGPLLGALGVVACLAIALVPRRATVAGRVVVAVAAVAALAVGLLSHPVAVIAPVVAAGGWWSLRRRDGGGSDLFAVLAPLVLVGAWYVARGAIAGDVVVDPTLHGLLDADGDVAIATAAGLAGHAAWVGLLSAPLARAPWTLIDGPAGWSQPLAWLGLALILLLPIAARAVRRPAPAVGLWLVWATLLVLSQLADPLASAQAPALLPLLLVGPALALGDLIKGVVSPVIVAVVCAAFVLWPTAQAASWFRDEPTLIAHERELFPRSLGLHLAAARYEAEVGHYTAALALLEGVERGTPGRAELVVLANLGLNRWGSARAELARVDEPMRTVLACRLGALADDIGTVRHCEAAREIVRGTRAEGDVIAALAKGLDRSTRTKAAEQLLKDALEEFPDDGRIYGALVELYDRLGYVPDAIALLERWRERAGASPALVLRLVAAYERKGLGDLQDKRWPEAVLAFDRALELNPEAHELRYHLARALAEVGEDERARAELAKAKAAGVEPPPPPGMTAPL